MGTAGTDNLRGYELQSVNQALDLIDVMIAARGAVTLSHLSRTFGLSKNKIFRILSTLEQRGLVEKDRLCQYRLGITAFGTARRILSSHSMLDHARPIMVELAATLNEAVYLATVVGSEAMFQEMIDCHHPIKTESFIGSRFPFPCVTDAGSGSREFEVAGIRISVNQLKEEATTVSAPLVESSGKIAGALVVLAPTFRMPLERISSEMIVPISAAARELSRKLGTTAGPAVQTCIQPKSLNYPVKYPVTVATTSSQYRQNGRQCHH
jgi:DNA-binding IclR family transcriptional regulator